MTDDKDAVVGLVVPAPGVGPAPMPSLDGIARTAAKLTSVANNLEAVERTVKRYHDLIAEIVRNAKPSEKEGVQFVEFSDELMAIFKQEVEEA